jgi:hypothetical protein
MLSAHTDSDFFGIGNPKVSQLFGLVVLLAALEALPARQWSEADWIGMGFDPSAAIADGPL